MARALRSAGCQVDLCWVRAPIEEVYSHLRPDEAYSRSFRMESLRHLWDVSGEYDLVHCHNEPDTYTVAALAGEAPVVHDTHDMISLRDGESRLAFFEGIANRGAAGRIYTTPEQMSIAEDMYGVGEPSVVVENYVSEPDIPRLGLPKLSASDGQIHVVYQGGIGGPSHRDFGEYLLALASEGIHVHIYPTRWNDAVARVFESEPLIHFEHPVSPSDIMRTMTQYDAGLIPFCITVDNRAFLDSTMANKLFEYIAAGIPVVASDLKTYRRFFTQYPVGKTFHGDDDIAAAVREVIGLKVEECVDIREMTYESSIGRVLTLYDKILRAK